MECVLMQAWKKTSSYLRYHSWYADTLGIDMQALRVPSFLNGILTRLQMPDRWESRPLRFVPAPKSQNWDIIKGKWEPIRRPRTRSSNKQVSDPIRPLAHVDLEDQVVATAILMCLADRVETELGDPRLRLTEENRKQVLAYGHRLFCDQDNGLRHRWGSTKLYRGYYQDYRQFLERPKVVESNLRNEGNQELDIGVVRSDLSKFYDRVRPTVLHEKLRRFQRFEDEAPFFKLAERVLNWYWHPSDYDRASKYADLHSIEGFDQIALPQGLVASGFFANIALIEFDSAMKSKLGQEFGKDGLRLEDVCYYVDDLRLVLSFPQSGSITEGDLEACVFEALKNLLSMTAADLQLSKEKTEALIESKRLRFLVKQSDEASRIQTRSSGTFDPTHGTELISAIESFFYRQRHYSNPETLKGDDFPIGVPDMPDETVARFAAGRMRRTFRSLRPLLPEEVYPRERASTHELDDQTPNLNLVITKSELDEKGKAFAALLVSEWIKNPGHVRLLRIALDFYPDHKFLDTVLKLLRPGWESSKIRGYRREIRLYCLAELFRAGATETAIVPDNESLPRTVNIGRFHSRLINEANEIVKAYEIKPRAIARFPWFLVQQVLLYLIARDQCNSVETTSTRRGGKLLRDYWGQVSFLRGLFPDNLEQRSVFLIEAITAFGIEQTKVLRNLSRVSPEFLLKLNSISPTVAKSVWKVVGNQSGEKSKQSAIRLGFESSTDMENMSLGLEDEPHVELTLNDVTSWNTNPFYEEENILLLAEFLLGENPGQFKDPIVPSDILFVLESPQPNGYEFGKIKLGSFELSQTKGSVVGVFMPPDWCENVSDRKRFNIGLLLRFALRGSTDFLTNIPKRASTSTPRYSTPISHWEQQRYSGFQGRDAFGPPWLPISWFTEELLFELLRWPGSGAGEGALPSLDELHDNVSTRLAQLKEVRGQINSTTFLEHTAPWPYQPAQGGDQRSLRIAVVQSVIPNMNHFKEYEKQPELNVKEIRSECRSHVAAIMSGLAQQLRVRESHRSHSDRGSIDLVVFPELSIHPQDVDTLITPFVRQYRCIALVGLVYHHHTPYADSPLINSAMWLIPDWSNSRGLQIKRIEQGKAYLTQHELSLNPAPEGFRPVQWVINYQWCKDADAKPPLRLTASICYDATDISLSAELRTRSDLYFICALNKDVGTFDRMAEALNYHMFQGVVVVNNGHYGGTSFHMPFKSSYKREVFNLRGQSQASVVFAEVDPQKLINRPSQDFQQLLPEGKWKSTPAGL